MAKTNLEIISYPNGIYGATTYLVSDKISKEAFLVDCTCDIEEIEKQVKKENLTLKYVLITHGHFDHVFCIDKLKEKFPQTQVLMNKEDMPLLKNVGTQCTMAGIEGIKVPCVDGLIKEDTKNLKIGDYKIDIIETPGHSQGGTCYLINDKENNFLFSGDTLFQESVGRCDLFGGDFKKILSSIKEKLFSLDENTIVFPGHGDSTTIAHEKKYNSYCR